MIEHYLDIATAGGAMNSFVVHPEVGGPFPVRTVGYCLSGPFLV